MVCMGHFGRTFEFEDCVVPLGPAVGLDKSRVVAVVV